MKEQLNNNNRQEKGEGGFKLNKLYYRNAQYVQECLECSLYTTPNAWIDTNTKKYVWMLINEPDTNSANNSPIYRYRNIGLNKQLI